MLSEHKENLSQLGYKIVMNIDQSIYFKDAREIIA